MRDGFEHFEQVDRLERGAVKASPAKTQAYRIGNLAGPLPLSQDAPLLRGGALRSGSSASLLTLGWRGAKRRNSMGEEEEDRGLAEEDWGPVSLVQRRESAAEVLMTPAMRSIRLIGNANPRYHWNKYYKSEEELKQMRKAIRNYYERNNFLIARYLYIDRLLDSSLPHTLLQEYSSTAAGVSDLGVITEEPSTPPPEGTASPTEGARRVKRTPKDLYKLPDEGTPLLDDEYPDIKFDVDEDADSGSPVVMVAIYVNLFANIALLIGKIVVTLLTSSLSVLASLVDSALDFLSTIIVGLTTWLIARPDQYTYPIGRKRLEPVGVLVFSIIMELSFFQVGIQCLTRLLSEDREIVQLSNSAIIIMTSTVCVKGACFVWCRTVKNSAVEALAADALTDVFFNVFSIIFPLLGFYFKLWYLDALGGLLLSCFVIVQWMKISAQHIRNLCGAAGSADERNVLLYLAMRFAKTIRKIQALNAYHAGDALHVECDIVLDPTMNLKDSHDLAESLSYVLESVPYVDRAFVHCDYDSANLPSHMAQQSS